MYCSATFQDYKCLNHNHIFFPYTIYDFIVWNINNNKPKSKALDETIKTLLEIIDYLPHRIFHLAISGQRRRQTTPTRATRVLILGSSTVVAIPSNSLVKAHYLGCVQPEDFESASMNFGGRFWNSAFSVLLQRPHPLPPERTLYVNLLYEDLKLHHLGATKQLNWRLHMLKYPGLKQSFGGPR